MSNQYGDTAWMELIKSISVFMLIVAVANSPKPVAAKAPTHQTIVSWVFYIEFEISS